MKSNPTIEELSAATVDYYNARRAVDKFKPHVHAPEEGQALYDELLHCEQVILYAGSLLTKGSRQGQHLPKIFEQVVSNASKQ